MDKTDRNILNELIENPKKPFSRIAENIGATQFIVQKRYERMKKDGVLFGSSIIIDLAKLGYQGKAFIFITNCKDCDSAMTVKALENIQNIFLVSEIVGAFDVLAMAVFRDLAEFKEIINKIRAETSVMKVEVAITDETPYPVREEFTKIFNP